MTYATESMFPGLKSIAINLQSKVSSLEEICKEMKSKSSNLENQLAISHNKYNSLLEEVIASKDATELLEEHISRYEAENVALKDSLSILENEKQDFAAKNVGLEETMSEQVTLFEEKCNLLYKECRELESLLESETKDKAELEEQLAERTNLIVGCEERINELDKEKDTLAEKYEKKSDAYKTLKQRFLQEKKKWEGKKQSQKRTIQDLETRLLTTNQKFEDTAEEINLMSGWFSKLNKIVDDSKQATDVTDVLKPRDHADAIISKGSIDTAPTVTSAPSSDSCQLIDRTNSEQLIEESESEISDSDDSGASDDGYLLNLVHSNDTNSVSSS